VSTPLAAELGRLAAPAHSAPFDDVRLALLDAIVAAKAAGRMDQDAWEEVFGGAVRSVRLRVLADAEQMVRSAAAHSRYPARRLQALLPDTEVAEMLLNRLTAEAMPLERYAGLGDDPVSRRARAAALETAWDGAVRVATAETARWRTIAMQVAAWRRPTGMLWTVSIALFLVALIVAGWLSGVIASPAWFRPINDLWWRLWP
jgi:hypothetical protein